MSTDETNDFIPEHLAKWRTITRKYLLAPIEKAALAIADHPQPPLGEKMRILSFVGSNTARFKAFDGDTHDTATALALASKSGNGEAAIVAFQKLQSSCLVCHQTFRKPFVEHFHGKAEIRQ